MNQVPKELITTSLHQLDQSTVEDLTLPSRFYFNNELYRPNF